MRTRLLVMAAAAIALAACAAQTGEEDLPPVSAAAPAAPWDDPLEIIGEDEPRTYYQYIDEAGDVRFAESLDEVPDEWKDMAGQITLDVPPPNDPAESRMVRKLRAQRGTGTDR